MSESGHNEPGLWQENRVNVGGDAAEEMGGTGHFLLSDCTEC